MVKYEHDPVMEASTLCNNNEKLFSLFTDFALLSKEGTVFPCHRLILSSQSQVMMSVMNQSDLGEKETRQLKLEYSDEVVKNFRKYFYSRQD